MFTSISPVAATFYSNICLPGNKGALISTLPVQKGLLQSILDTDPPALCFVAVPASIKNSISRFARVFDHELPCQSHRLSTLPLFSCVVAASSFFATVMDFVGLSVYSLLAKCFCMCPSCS